MKAARGGQGVPAGAHLDRLNEVSSLHHSEILYVTWTLRGPSRQFLHPHAKKREKRAGRRWTASRGRTYRPRLNHYRLLRSRQQQWRGRRQGQSNKDHRRGQCEEDLADTMRHHFGSLVSGSEHDAADDHTCCGFRPTFAVTWVTALQHYLPPQGTGEAHGRVVARQEAKDQILTNCGNRQSRRPKFLIYKCSAHGKRRNSRLQVRRDSRASLRRGIPRSMVAAEAATVGRTLQRLPQAAEMIDSDAPHTTAAAGDSVSGRSRSRTPMRMQCNFFAVCR